MSDLSGTLRMGRKLHEAANILARIEEFLEANSYDKSYEDDPDLKWDERSYVSVSYGYSGLDFTCAGPNAAELMVQLRRWIGGKLWHKNARSGAFTLWRETEYSGLRVELSADREKVCEKRTELKPVTIRAQEADPERAERLRQQAADLAAQAEALMADQPERVEEQEVEEWDCRPVLAEVAADAS